MNLKIRHRKLDLCKLDEYTKNKICDIISETNLNAFGISVVYRISK
jgi:hypothetical protein